MKRFWQHLDRDLFWLSGGIAFLAAYVAASGEYPPGKYQLAPPPHAERLDALLLVSGALILAAIGFIVRGIKKKRAVEGEKAVTN